MTNSDTAAVV